MRQAAGWQVHLAGGIDEWLAVDDGEHPLCG